MAIYENFISYRRNDTLPEVQAIYSALLKRGYSTFCDINTLSRGKVEDSIKTFVRSCTNFILVLGPHSLDRCQNPDDLLRLEIREAISYKKNVICIFINRNDVHEDLPTDIQEVKHYNGLKFDFLYFNAFIECLCERFLTKGEEIKNSNSNRDFKVINGVLVKYLGPARIINIPRNVRKIGKNAFRNKTRITSVEFHEEIEEIAESAFERCIELTNIFLPEKLKTIKKKAFYRCYSLAFISFNDSLETIEDEAFGFCSKLKLIDLGSALHNISSTAFNGCSKLLSINVNSSNRYLCDVNGILYNKELTTLIRCPENYDTDVVVVPHSIETIGGWGFSGCLSVIDVALPRNLKDVKKFAFKDCVNILSLTLPDSIEAFDVTALDGWNKYQRVITGKSFNPLIKYEINQRLLEIPEIKTDGQNPSYIIIKTTFESKEEANEMAKMLVEKHLVASAQLQSLQAMYWWENEFCDEKEVELSCITKDNLYETIESFIREHHSYDNCQLLSIPIKNVSKSFGDWIEEVTLALGIKT